MVAIEDSLYGLQGIGSDSAEVHTMMSVLLLKTDRCSGGLLDAHNIDDGLFVQGITCIRSCS